MDTIGFSAPGIPKLPKWFSLELLSVTLLSVLLAWYLQFHWKRRDMYQKAAKFKGHFAWPLIGNGATFVGDATQTAMGTKINTQTSDSPLAEYIDRTMEIIFMKMFSIFYHVDFIYNLTHYKKEESKLAQKVLDFTLCVIKMRKSEYDQRLRDAANNLEVSTEEDTSRRAFLDLLIENNKFSDKELKDEVTTFIVAGSDTTATAMSFMFVILGMFPEIQEKVYQEVIEVLGPDRTVECSDLPKLKYTERFIKESLRMFPIGAFVVRGVSEDIPLNKDQIIPKGAGVIIGIMKLHRNPKYWPDPLRFDPDRFLPEEVAKRHPYVYIPFSAGPRNCIGMRFAMMAMKTQVASLVRHFKFSTPYKRIEDVELKANILLRFRDGCWVSIEERN